MAQPQQSHEHREHERLPCALQVSVSSSSEHNFYTGFTQNISEGGIFVSTSQLLDVGTELAFEFVVDPDPEPIHVTGVVRWVREATEFTKDVPPGMGIMFTNLTPEVSRSINDFIKRRRDSIFMDVD